MRNATSRCTITASTSHHGGQGSDCNQPDKKRRRDIVREVGDHTHRAAGDKIADIPARLECQRIRLDDRQPPGRLCGDLPERGNEASVRLHGHDVGRSLLEKGAREPTRARPDLDHGDAVE